MSIEMTQDALGKLKNSSNDERINFLRQDVFIRYERLESIKQDFEYLANYNGIRPPSKIIYGPSNNGKTSMVRNICKKMSLTVDGDYQLPVIFCQSPPHANMKHLVVSILSAYSTPYRHTDTISKLSQQLEYKIKEAKTKIIVIDEFQSLLTGTMTAKLAVANMLKTISNASDVSIVGVGVESALNILDLDEHLARRFDTVPLPLWEYNDEFSVFLKKLEHTLPLRGEYTICEGRIAQKLIEVTGGRIGEVVRIVKLCAENSIRTGSEVIGYGDIAKYDWMKPNGRRREIRFSN